MNNESKKQAAPAGANRTRGERQRDRRILHRNRPTFKTGLPSGRGFWPCCGAALSPPWRPERRASCTLPAAFSSCGKRAIKSTPVHRKTALACTT